MKRIFTVIALLTAMILPTAALAQRSPMPYAKIQFFDRNGKPLAGGKLYSYVAGTTSPTPTYSSYSGSANTNPVILDSSGRAEVWMDSSVSYKFILKDRNDVQQWSVDSITDYGGSFEASGSEVDLTSSVTGILPAANGGTANGYTAFTGPTTSTRTFTLPDASDTISTFDTAGVFTASQATTPYDLTVAGDGTIATDASYSNVFSVTLTTNCPCTLSTPTNPEDGQIATWEVIQASGGNETLAYSAVFTYGTTVTEPTITVTADKRDFITAIYNSTTEKWYVIQVSQAY